MVQVLEQRLLQVGQPTPAAWRAPAGPQQPSQQTLPLATLLQAQQTHWEWRLEPQHRGQKLQRGPLKHTATEQLLRAAAVLQRMPPARRRLGPHLPRPLLLARLPLADLLPPLLLRMDVLQRLALLLLARSLLSRSLLTRQLL